MSLNYAEISSKSVKKLAELEHISITQLAERIGVAQTTLNASLNSKKGIPIDTLIKIADFFNTTVPELCDKRPMALESGHFCLDSYKLNSCLTDIIEIYNDINEEGQEKLVDYARDLKGNSRYKKESQFRLGAKEA